MTARGPRLVWLAIASAALLACGSRTDIDAEASPQDGGALAPEAGDARTAVDSGRSRDAAAGTDGAAPPDAGSTCADGGLTTRAYLFDGAGVLYRYDVTHGTYAVLGTPSCGGQGGPWTMTASRENAYVEYNDGSVYAVDLGSLACTQTAFVPGQLGLTFDFGMAVADVAGVETFFVYGQPDGSASPILAKSDLSSFVLTLVGEIQPAPPALTNPINLSADSLGHLYGFAPDGALLQIDQATGALLFASSTGVTTDATWAGLTSGTDVFLFVDGRVARYDASSEAVTSSQSIDIGPIGAGSFVVCDDE